MPDIPWAGGALKLGEHDAFVESVSVNQERGRLTRVTLELLLPHRYEWGSLNLDVKKIFQSTGVTKAINAEVEKLRKITFDDE